MISNFLIFFLQFTISLFIWEGISYVIRFLRFRKQIKELISAQQKQDEFDIDKIAEQIAKIDQQYGLPEDKKWN